MRPVARYLAWVGLALAGGMALAWAFRPRPVAVEVARAARGRVEVTVDAEGRTRIRDRYIVATPVAGRLRRIELKPGDAVEAGRTVVAALEPSDPELLDPRARALAEARVKAAAAARARAVPQLEQARTAHDYARVALERAVRLHAERTLSHVELDAAEERERVAADVWRAAEFAAQVAAFELEQAQAVLGGGAGDAAGPGASLEVRAPVTGRVLRVFQESSTVVAPGARILELGDPANLEVEVEALSSDAVRVVPGARVWLEQWGGDGPLPARVRLVEPSAFRKVSALGVEEQRVLVIADLAGPREAWARVGDGYRVEARIVVAEASEALLVPTGALFREEDAWAVFVVERGRAVARRVVVGSRNDLVTEVCAGLREGEVVILHPSDRVSEGTRVRAGH